MGAWIETTASLRTPIDTEQFTAVRNAIREMDSYLGDYVSGGMPPGSYEEEYLYLDALSRATVPVESSAPATVLEELRAQGEKLPDFLDPAEVTATSGVRSLHMSEVKRALTQPGKSPTPRTHEAVRFAQAWHEATKALDAGLLVSYGVTDAPGQALVERLDGNLDSYVTAMRTGPRAVILNDATGNRLERSDLEQRLGLDGAGAATVMTGLREALEAAVTMRQAPSNGPGHTGPALVTDSVEDYAVQTKRAPAAGIADPLSVAQMPPQGPPSASTPSWS